MKRTNSKRALGEAGAVGRNSMDDFCFPRPPRRRGIGAQVDRGDFCYPGRGRRRPVRLKNAEGSGVDVASALSQPGATGIYVMAARCEELGPKDGALATSDRAIRAHGGRRRRLRTTAAAEHGTASRIYFRRQVRGRCPVHAGAAYRGRRFWCGLRSALQSATDLAAAGRIARVGTESENLPDQRGECRRPCTKAGAFICPTRWCCV